MTGDQLLMFAVDCATVMDEAGIPDDLRWLVIPQWAGQAMPALAYADRFTVCVVADESLVREDCALFGRADRTFSKRISA